MVFLKDLKTQWPWNPNDTNHEDKQIFTHIVDEEDKAREWRMNIDPPSHGFTYTGIRIVAENLPDNYCIMSRLVMGSSKSPVFGLPWDNTLSNNKQWKELGFPLTHRMIALTEDGMDIIIRHERPCFGYVQMIAQRFDDFVADESNISYAFVHHKTNEVVWVISHWGSRLRPHVNYMAEFREPIKIVPCLYRVLNPNLPDWPDTTIAIPSISLIGPLDFIQPFPYAT